MRALGSLLNSLPSYSLESAPPRTGTKDKPVQTLWESWTGGSRKKHQLRWSVSDLPPGAETHRTVLMASAPHPQL